MKAMLMLFSVLLTSTLALATELTVEEAQAKAKATFRNLAIKSFKPSPIEGGYEMNLGGRIIYYSPDAEVLIFGEMFSKNGESLTAASMGEDLSKATNGMDLSAGLQIGDPEGPLIVEISDPDCYYCRQAHAWFQEQKGVNRVVFFDTRIHPDAEDKVIQILCAEDKALAYEEAFSGKEIANATLCEEGKATLARHKEFVANLGVSGTPTYLLGERQMMGFQKDALVNYLNQTK